MTLYEPLSIIQNARGGENVALRSRCVRIFLEQSSIKGLSASRVPLEKARHPGTSPNSPIPRFEFWSLPPPHEQPGPT